MEILISSSVWDPKPWVEGLSASKDITKIHVWPTAEDISNVEVVFVWKPLSEGIINKLPKLKWISSLGAGVDHLTSDPQIPSHIPITRIVDPFLARDMSNYVIMGLMMYQRSMLTHLSNQKETRWDRITYRPLKVGIMGLGALGSHLADRLVLLGFEVFGYSRTLKDIDGIKCFDVTRKDEFLSHSEVLVNLLPVTPLTESILNADLFGKMPDQSYLINVARGNHLVENDLIKALDNGQLSGALLDVFREEPLPTGNPLWQHDKVTITPHVASVTTPESAIKLLLRNFELLNSNQELLHQIDLEQGY